jgi:hypothetical protein
MMAANMVLHLHEVIAMIAADILATLSFFPYKQAAWLTF